ncbi:MAG: aspartate 1-decarboxylase [Planctomycetota bacterium]|nr:MAG: aspartate 1-decarboxylase [Planctomycetota bacterium]REK43459.1 MAG: aspartate 1-decarboxylase [Planctomycetota bacterium]
MPAMFRTFVHAKIHGIRVTECKLRYTGSAEIDADLLAASGIAPFEQVQIVNTNNAERMITYAFPGKPGEFTLNGAAARLGAVGDECLVIAYRQEEQFSGAKVLLIDPADNSVRDTLRYPAADEVDAIVPDTRI